MNDSNILTAKRASYLLALAKCGKVRTLDSERPRRQWALKWGYVKACNGEQWITEKGKQRLRMAGYRP